MASQVLLKHPSSVKLLRAYARFLEASGCCSWGACKHGGAKRQAVRCAARALHTHIFRKSFVDALPRCLQDVRSNPWAAQRYYGEAERLEIEASDLGQEGGEG